MKYIVINKDDIIDSDQLENTAVPLWKNEDTQEESSLCAIRFNDSNGSTFRNYIKYSVDDIRSARESYTDLNPTNDTYYQREPFASKKLSSGKSLFRRKHGKKETIISGEEKDIIFDVPYGNCKINKLEVIDANALDRIDLMVLDTPTGSISSVPNYMLNQFGFDVIVSDLLYSDKSDYDADLIKDMQIKIVYKNDGDQDKTVGFNIIFHEVI